MEGRKAERGSREYTWEYNFTPSSLLPQTSEGRRGGGRNIWMEGKAKRRAGKIWEYKRGTDIKRLADLFI